MRWIHSPPSDAAVAALSCAPGISPLLAALLLRGGLATDAGSAVRFLKPALSELGDPFLLANVEAAARRLRQAIVGRESVAVLGDYDVDGVTSTALLVSILRRLGLSPRFVVPRRMEDGYGLSRSAVDRALEGQKPDLFVALDCGTNARDEITRLRALGVDVIVIDHHRSKENEEPVTGLLINPHAHPRADDDAWHHLCTVGLVFKLAHGLLKLLRADNHPVALELKLRDSLDLVALGTVADLVPLTGENRIFARHGLTHLRHATRPGLRALMEIAGVRLDQELKPADVSFRLGPRINASGRLADAAVAVELLLSEDEEFCAETARQLDAFNRERQEIERQITAEADRMIETHFLDQPGIVLHSEAWHPGVVGIVAGRVTRKYHRPCIVLGNENGTAKGSGRSVDGINLVEVLGTCPGPLGSWGGHPMAVGVALPSEHVESFRAQFAAAVRAATGGSAPDPRLELAAWLTPEQIGEELMADLDALHPFGQANPEPIFGLRGIVLRRPPEVFKERHFRFAFEDTRGWRHHGVAWGLAGRLPPAGAPLDLAVELKWNFYGGRKLIQLELLDWCPAATS
jgi:single-stranded-DNA-specific exonuclease